ncbi:hypothetical protein F5Y16DRAFT_234048 [Xylariaceae sp. FL0255]|nr:hypothetical protein F5Y16DRAFT_234048 [Xylariaceae sp. FL0255]
MTCCQPGNQEQQPDLSEPPPTPALSIGYEADIRLPSSPSTLPTSATPGDIKGPSLNKRDKNRAAAARCRDKARKSRSELEELERELFLKNQMLQTETKALQEEVLQLKHDILSHASCDSAAIQRYIEYTAENYGKGS